jgi:hypothetical protein
LTRSRKEAQLDNTADGIMLEVLDSDPAEEDEILLYPELDTQLIETTGMITRLGHF